MFCINSGNQTKGFHGIGIHGIWVNGTRIVDESGLLTKADTLEALADKLTVYVSSNDRALVLSRIINRSSRRGESTLSPDQLDEAVRIAELIEPGDNRMDLVDVTPVNRTRNFHSFSLETPEFFDDLYLRLVNYEMPDSRLLYQIKTEDGEVYWVLTRGR